MTASLLLLLALPAAAAQRGTAGAVVQSDEWVIRKEKGEEEFKGNVRMEQGDDRFRADWALHRIEEDRWRAKGGVVVERRAPEGTVTASGDEGRIDRKQGTAELTGRPVRAERRFKDAEGTERAWRAEAPRLSWDQARGSVLLEQGALLSAEGMQARARTATVAEGGGQAVLEGGRPVVTLDSPRMQGAVQADRFTVTDAPRVLEGTGGVRGWLYVAPPEKR